MQGLPELAELAVLVAMSLILVVEVIFRPIGARVSRKNAAVSARKGKTGPVLGPDPRREAAQISGKLLRDAQFAAATIDWERGRREQSNLRLERSLVAVPEAR